MKFLWIFVAFVTVVIVGVTSFFVGATFGAASVLTANACGTSAGSGVTAGSGSSSEVGPDKDSILRAAVEKSGGNNWVVVAMLTGSYLETRWDSQESDGEAYGPYQIQMPGVVHPDVTIAEARDIVFATDYMYPFYLAATRREEVQELLAAGDYQSAAEANAFYAERPAKIYSQSQGADMVAEAYQASLALMQANGLSVDFSQQVVNEALAVQEAATITGRSSDACKSGGTTSTAEGAALIAQSGATGDRLTVLQAASAQLGVPYSWGGGNAGGATFGICESGPAANACRIKGFDCSGLTEYAYARVGIELPSTAATQWQATRDNTVVPRGGDLALARPGDLVFFSGYKTLTDPGHVGIYIGGGKMINAPRSGEDIQIHDITTAHWRNTFVGATSPYPTIV